jgi:uncharacterized membrane protein YraQ (UPF0718 family)
MTQIAYTLGLRFCQVFESSGPTLILGVFVAAVLRSLVRPESIRRFFDAGPLGGTLRAFLVAAMLPVGALGALPIALEFRRVGVPRATVFAFAVAAPLLNPLALSHALTSLGGFTILWTAAAVALACIAIPLSLIRFRENENTSEGPVGIASSAGRRVVNLLLSAARISSGALVGYVLLAAAVTAMAAACVDGHTLIHVLSAGNPAATLLMTVVALPAYVSFAGGITLMHGTWRRCGFRSEPALPRTSSASGRTRGCSVGWVGPSDCDDLRRSYCLRSVSCLS